MYFGIRIRNTTTNQYYDLDTLTDLAFLIVLPSGRKLIARKDFDAARDNAPLHRYSPDFYYCKFSASDTASETETGIGSYEIGTIAPDADIGKFISISDPISVRFTLSNLSAVI